MTMARHAYLPPHTGRPARSPISLISPIIIRIVNCLGCACGLHRAQKRFNQIKLSFLRGGS